MQDGLHRTYQAFSFALGWVWLGLRNIYLSFAMKIIIFDTINWLDKEIPMKNVLIYDV